MNAEDIIVREITTEIFLVRRQQLHHKINAKVFEKIEKDFFEMCDVDRLSLFSFFRDIS